MVRNGGWGQGAVAAALLVAVAGCGQEDGEGGAEPGSSAPERDLVSHVRIEDPRGDTENYTDGSPTKVTVNADLVAFEASYAAEGLTLEFEYAEPLDAAADEPWVIVHVGTREPDLEWAVQWEGGRPYVTGEDEIREPCRMEAPDLDRAAGRATLLFPATRGCLGVAPPERIVVGGAFVGADVASDSTVRIGYLDLP